ncbi:hypothetical protein MRX96_029899 [Rhipicephalus microplus]
MNIWRWVRNDYNLPNKRTFMAERTRSVWAPGGTNCAQATCLNTCQEDETADLRQRGAEYKSCLTSDAVSYIAPTPMEPASFTSTQYIPGRIIEVEETFSPSYTVNREKTPGSYLIPAIVHVISQPTPQPVNGPFVLVLVPTRQSAVQVHRQVTDFEKYTAVHSRVPLLWRLEGTTVEEAQQGEFPDMDRYSQPASIFHRKRQGKPHLHLHVPGAGRSRYNASRGFREEASHHRFTCGTDAPDADVHCV